LCEEQCLGQTVQVRIYAAVSTTVVEVDDANDDLTQAGSSIMFAGGHGMYTAPLRIFHRK
jgi:hypothetical protein